MVAPTVLGLFILGHVLGAFSFYSVHRWIFHGSRKNKVIKFIFKLPLLGKLAEKGRRIHQQHHKETIRLGREIGNHMNLFFPLWAKLTIASITTIIAMVSFPLSMGLLSFFPVYAYRHNAAHLGSSKPWARHHLHHHYKNAKVNHGGIYPIFDKIFGTHEEPKR